MSDDITVHDSSGNVFADLGIENAEEYLAKSELAAEILWIVQRRRLTQAEAGKLLVSGSPKCPNCSEAAWMGFPPIGCFAFITHLGYDIQIRCPSSRPYPGSYGGDGRIALSVMDNHLHVLLRLESGHRPVWVRR